MDASKSGIEIALVVSVTTHDEIDKSFDLKRRRWRASEIEDLKGC